MDAWIDRCCKCKNIMMEAIIRRWIDRSMLACLHCICILQLHCWMHVGPARQPPRNPRGNQEKGIDARMPPVIAALPRFPQVTVVDGSVAIAGAAIAAVRMRVRISHASSISISNGDGRWLMMHVMRVQIPWACSPDLTQN